MSSTSACNWPMLLATGASTGRLLLQIAELERLGANRSFTQYLTAYYHFNKHEFVKAQADPDAAAAGGGAGPAP